MKKIQIFLIVSLTFVLIEMLLGFSLVYYGVVCKEVDGIKAGEMLEFIQKHNPQYYHTLITEPSSMSDFQSFYTKKGDPLIVTGGIIFVFFHKLILYQFYLTLYTIYYIGISPSQSSSSFALLNIYFLCRVYLFKLLLISPQLYTILNLTLVFCNWGKR